MYTLLVGISVINTNTKWSLLRDWSGMLTLMECIGFPWTVDDVFPSDDSFVSVITDENLHKHVIDKYY